MLRKPAMNSSTLKPSSHHIGDEGDRRHEERKRAEDGDMLSAVEGREEYWAMPKSLSNIQTPDAIDDRDRQDIGQKERREHDALHPAFEPVDAERDTRPSSVLGMTESRTK